MVEHPVDLQLDAELRQLLVGRHVDHACRRFVDRVADEVFEDKGIKLVVSPKSLVYLNGTELDFAREGLNEGFQFNNPNEKERCGCGESFTV